MQENSEISPPRARFVRLNRLLGAIALVVAVALGFMGYIGLFNSNFREVTPGKCYRSAQLKPEALKETIASRGLKSVLNLRGERKNEEWYKGEVAVCETAKIDHTDINIGLGELPKPSTLKLLVEKLEAGPYPMLLHCRSGADRSGLAGAFYRHIVEKKPLEEAEADQVTWRYGHFGIGKAKCINEFFKLYHDTAHGQSLKDWLNNTYPAEYEKCVDGAEKSRVAD